MCINVNLNRPLTLGELRELVNNGKLSKFPDDIQIKMYINLCKENVIYEYRECSTPVLSITGDEKEITFYNYI